MTSTEIAVVGLIVFALIVPITILIVMLLRLRALFRVGASEDRALKILRERFARGEIDEEEFMRRKRILESSES